MSVENGFVPTPPIAADLAAASTFAVDRPGHVDDDRRGRLLLPGLGTGRLFDAVRRYCTAGEGWMNCRSFDYPMPKCVGVETDPERIDEFHDTHPDASINVHHADFLLEPPEGAFDWVLSNPPFVRYHDIDTGKRDVYRERFRTATNQFDLFVPFFEQALRLLRPGGWLTFFFPVAALCRPFFEDLRWEIRSQFVEPIWYLPPEKFDAKVETVMIGVQKKPSDFGRLWLESLYIHEVRELLEGLGVDDVDEAIDRYYEEHNFTEMSMEFTTSQEYDDWNVGRQTGLKQFTRPRV